MELSRDMRQVRAATMRLRSAPDARARLMAEFGQRRRRVWALRGLAWATAALTVLLLAGALKQVRWAGRGVAPRAVEAEWDLRTAEDQDLMAENGFVPVPYAAPLAPGEFVEVVQRELTPAALTRMGFVIQAAYGVEVTTDLMVGED